MQSDNICEILWLCNVCDVVKQQLICLVTIDLASRMKQGRQSRQLDNFFVEKLQSAYKLSPERERTSTNSGASKTKKVHNVGRQQCVHGCSQSQAARQRFESGVIHFLTLLIMFIVPQRPIAVCINQVQGLHIYYIYVIYLLRRDEFNPIELSTQLVYELFYVTCRNSQSQKNAIWLIICIL